MANKLFSDLAKGTYVGAISYTVGDFVDYNGSSYACILNSTGNLPTNTTYWALLASKGDIGDNATADAGTTTTLAAGESATVTNVGTTSDAIFNFAIPKGDAGVCVESVAFVGNNMVFTLDDASTVTLVDAKIDLKGDTGAQVDSVAFVGDDMIFTLDDSTTVTLTGAKTALKGDTGKGITSIIKTNTVGLVDTYTITYSDNTTSTFSVTNGAKGDTGDIGIDWQGAWSAGTYTITQAVSHNGSSWIATTTTTEEPSISATDWDILASRGQDGTGIGDFMADGSVPMTGLLTLKTGTITVAPIKFVAGINLTTPVAGVVEFDGTDLFISI